MLTHLKAGSGELVAGSLDKYFLSPIRVESGYNIINTITYAVLALISLYIIYKGLSKLKFKFDLKFFLAVLPFIILGSSMRAFVDAGYYARTFWLVSPGIYLLITFLFLFTILSSWLIGYALIKKDFIQNTLRGTILSGSLLVIINFILVANVAKIENIMWFFGILSLFIIISVIIFFILKQLKCSWAVSKLGFTAILAHLFDATATFILVDFFGGWEKHPLPRFVIEKLGSGLAFYPLKLIVLLPAVYLITTEIKDKQLRNFLFIAIATLGFAEGLRNLISLILV